MVCDCNPSYLRGWGRKTPWAQEVKASVRWHHTTALQAGWQSKTLCEKNPNPKPKQHNQDTKMCLYESRALQRLLRKELNTKPPARGCWWHPGTSAHGADRTNEDLQIHDHVEKQKKVGATHRKICTGLEIWKDTYASGNSKICKAGSTINQSINRHPPCQQLKKKIHIITTGAENHLIKFKTHDKNS